MTIEMQALKVQQHIIVYHKMNMERQLEKWDHCIWINTSTELAVGSSTNVCYIMIVYNFTTVA